ncbi:MAG TPA: DUF3824 domain-containing protein [Candidatus Dormibacteraeota bacterium]|nr:DUF3824 domain-containing protein [Candidatus Dormibacteraeota bacterium]
MQAYQSAPCPYCGITWNQLGAQSCANCRNTLPPPQASYAASGYAPGPPQGQQPGAPQPPGFPYGPPNYPLQAYPQQPQYPGAPSGYPMQPGQPGPGYPSYAPPGYGQTPGYPPQPGAYGQMQGYPGYAPGAAPVAAPATTTLRLFGQTVTLPVVVPPIVLQYQQAIAYGAVALLALLVLLFGVMPVVAASQISSANQSLSAAASHQAKVDTAFAQLISSPSGSSDPNALKAQWDKLAKSFNDGLSLVQSDEAAVNGVDQRLSVIHWVAPSKGANISSERHRLAGALAGLNQADTAMTSAVNEAKVIQPYNDALIDYATIVAALAKHDLVGAGAPYPDAQQKIELAMSLSGAPGLPAQIAKQVSSFNDVLTNTESLVQAIQAKDPAGIKKYTDAMNAALKAMSGPAETLPADYESKTFGPMQKAYDTAMKTISAGA